jgi:hypothetical protein
MKFICFGYIDEQKWETTPKDEQNALMDACFAYDDVLREKGHFVGGEGLQSAKNTVTLRYRGGGVSVTDGPFAEAKEQVGGFLVLEATDLEQAIQLLSKHPGVKAGPWEIRAVLDMSEMIRDSAHRREERQATAP